MSERFSAFAIENCELSTFDVEEIYLQSKKVIDFVRANKKPRALILNTYRFSSHSKSDDGRDKNEVELWKKKDPLRIIGEKIPKEILCKIEVNVKQEIENIIDKAISAPKAMKI